jgi:uncharacterized DUF497 family protein
MSKNRKRIKKTFFTQSFLSKKFSITSPIDNKHFDIYIIYMIFEWDENKAKINYTKHKVTFEEAQTVFYDENALLLADEKHSNEEDRFILMGMSSMMNTLLVCFCKRSSNNNEIIRIISSRKANKKEIEHY